MSAFELEYNEAKRLTNAKQFNEAILIASKLSENDDEFCILGYFILLKIYCHWKEKQCYNLITDHFIEKLIFKVSSIKENITETKELNYVIDIVNNIVLEQYSNIKLLLFYENNKIITIELYNFSKVDDFVFGSSMIKEKHLNVLQKCGFIHIINLVGEHPPIKIDPILNSTIKYHYFPTRDRCATNTETMTNILEIMIKAEQAGEKTIVHCMGGIGRTNMVLACYLIKKTNMSPSEATTILNKQRKVIITPLQMFFIKDFYAIQNSPAGAHIKKIKNIGLIMLIGLPCSGKSTFSQKLLLTYKNIIHINQDELGREDCEEIFSSNAKSDCTIILDRCNLTQKERKEWLNCYKQLTQKKIVAICYNYDVNICIERAKNRHNHPTLSGGGDKLIRQLATKFEIPTEKEGFDQIMIVNDEESLKKLEKKFDIVNSSQNNEDFTKFPRTKHFINLGSATKDDKICDLAEQKDILQYDLIIEEKIDGANMGFRCEDGNIIAQNRTHVVCSKSHEQFKKLNMWINQHKDDLMSIFQRGHYIVFGEWLFFKHSIHYDKLPNHFILFDIYDIDKDEFLARSIVEDMIKDTKLCQIPIIYRGIATMQQLKQLVNSASSFYSGKVEGIYIRACVDDVVKYRCKIVRSDFVCGNTEWGSGKFTENKLV